MIFRVHDLGKQLVNFIRFEQNWIDSLQISIGRESLTEIDFIKTSSSLIDLNFLTYTLRNLWTQALHSWVFTLRLAWPIEEFQALDAM